jgi:hypothetical protein
MSEEKVWHSPFTRHKSTSTGNYFRFYNSFSKTWQTNDPEYFNDNDIMSRPVTIQFDHHFEGLDLFKSSDISLQDWYNNKVNNSVANNTTNKKFKTSRVFVRVYIQEKEDYDIFKKYFSRNEDCPPPVILKVATLTEKEVEKKRKEGKKYFLNGGVIALFKCVSALEVLSLRTQVQEIARGGLMYA